MEDTSLFFLFALFAAYALSWSSRTQKDHYVVNNFWKGIQQALDAGRLKDRFPEHPSKDLLADSAQ